MSESFAEKPLQQLPASFFRYLLFGLLPIFLLVLVGAKVSPFRLPTLWQFSGLEGLPVPSNISSTH
jgi:hypothetical protein